MLFFSLFTLPIIMCLILYHKETTIEDYCSSGHYLCQVQIINFIVEVVRSDHAHTAPLLSFSIFMPLLNFQITYGFIF